MTTVKTITSVGDLVDKVLGCPLSEYIPKLNRILRRTLPSDVRSIYCASTEKTYNLVTEYIREQVGISREHVRTLQLPSHIYNLNNYLKEHPEVISKDDNPTQLYLLKSLGFEKQSGYKSTTGAAVHGYDQCFEHRPENKWTGPRILLLTHIGFSEGTEIYQRAIRDAAKGQFKTFAWEFE